MITVPANLSVHPMDASASEELARFLGPRLASAPYSAAVDADFVRREILSDEARAIYAVRWQQRRHLGAWRGGQMVGFLDVASGIDSDSPEVPDYHPFGLIRLMVLPEQGEWIGAVADALLAAAQQFWQETGVGYVKAFHISTGYPSFQAGAGILPGEWGDQVRTLTAAGFLLRDRYYCLARRLVEPVEEVTPVADLSLVYRGDWRNRRYELYHRRIELVGRARVVRLKIDSTVETLALAKIVELYIDPEWRHKDIAKWLTRRMINDATHQGDVQMVVHLAQHRHAAMNLFIQHGFHELNYRGYSLEKALTQ